MNIYHNSAASIMGSLLTCYGETLRDLVEKKDPRFIVPLETKGALLIDRALKQILYSIPEGSEVIYRRAFDYLTPEDFRNSRFLIVDDTFVTGKSMRDTKTLLMNNGAIESNIFFAAFADFSDGTNLYQDIHEKTKFAEFDTAFNLRKENLFQAIEHELLSEELPFICDHLIFNSKGVDPTKYKQFMCNLEETGRLLYYGKRGSFTGGTILLDDLYNPEWPTPAKLRLWYKPDLEYLRIVPMAFPGSLSTQNNDSRWYKKILEILSEHPITMNARVTEQDKVDAASLFTRIDLLKYLKPIIDESDIRLSLTLRQLQRYYGHHTKSLTDTLHDEYQSIQGIQIPTLNTQKPIVNDSIEYMSCVKAITDFLRESYWKQKTSSTDRKEMIHKGETLSELISRFSPSFSPEQVHAAVDYCCDKGYIVPFWADRQAQGLVRCLRTTEKSIRPFEEVFGAAIVYSQDAPCHAWLIDKATAILCNSRRKDFPDNHIAVRKCFFGDVSRILIGKDSTKIWRQLPSDLWEVKTSKKEESVLFLHTEVGEAMDWYSDVRLEPYKMSLAAITYLLRNGKYNAGVLLNILTGHYGALDYIGHNLEEIVNALTNESPKENLQDIENHLKGAKQKFDAINAELHSKAGKDPLLVKLKRRATRLRDERLYKMQVDQVLSCVKHFPDARFYASHEELYNSIARLKDSVLRKDTIMTRQLTQPFERPDCDYGIDWCTRIRSLFLWINAYAASELPSNKFYHPYLFRSREEQDRWVLCYDLKGALRDKCAESSTTYRQARTSVKSMAKNWIIALGGQLTSDEVNEGDMEYGIFSTPMDALQAACWMSFHSEQLAYTHPNFPQSGAMGISLTRGKCNYVDMDGVGGNPLDLLGHFMKKKLNYVCGEAGRSRSEQFMNTNVHVVDIDTFGYNESIPQHGECNTAIDNISKREIKILPVLVSDFINKYRLPWQHRMSR